MRFSTLLALTFCVGTIAFLQIKDRQILLDIFKNLDGRGRVHYIPAGTKIRCQNAQAQKLTMMGHATAERLSKRHCDGTELVHVTPNVPHGEANLSLICGFFGVECLVENEC